MLQVTEAEGGGWVAVPPEGRADVAQLGAAIGLSLRFDPDAAKVRPRPSPPCPPRHSLECLVLSAGGEQGGEADRALFRPAAGRHHPAAPRYAPAVRPLFLPVCVSSARTCVFSEPRSFAVRCGGLCSPFPRLALSVDRPGRRSCGILGGSCCPKVAGVASLVAEMHDAPMAAASADARAETRAIPFVDTG